LPIKLFGLITAPPAVKIFELIEGPLASVTPLPLTEAPTAADKLLPLIDVPPLAVRPLPLIVGPLPIVVVPSAIARPFATLAPPLAATPASAALTSNRAPPAVMPLSAESGFPGLLRAAKPAPPDTDPDAELLLIAPNARLSAPAALILPDAPPITCELETIEVPLAILRDGSAEPLAL